MYNYLEYTKLIIFACIINTVVLSLFVVNQINLDKSDIFQSKKGTVKKEHKFARLQPCDGWKIPLLKELTNVNQGVLFFLDDN